VTDEIACQWLENFDEYTKERVKRGQYLLLLMDGHGPHQTFEFLSACEEKRIIAFPFLPHTTHFSQPLDDKYKQKYRVLNNHIIRYGGDFSDKRSFFRPIDKAREDAFKPPIIRESSKDCGIWPFDTDSVLKKLETKVDPAPDLKIFGDEPHS
jgi:hypothetical protein